MITLTQHMWCSRSLCPLVTRRLISLMRPTETTIIPTQAELKTATDTNAEPLFSENNNEPLLSSRFQVLGQPPTMASLVVPSSVALYVRRGCLISLHGSPSIAMSYEWVGFWFNLLRYGTLKPSIYHRLISTTKFDALVSPNFVSNRLGPWLGLSSSPFRTLCLLTLDGTADWNVWGKNSIVAYEGNTSLELKPPNFTISRRNKPAYSSNYQTLQGRGNVLLSGSGSVYTIELKDADDEIIIRSEHLLAVSGSTQLNIKESISKQTLTPPENGRLKKKKEIKPEEIRDFDIKMFFEISTNIVISAWNWSKHAYATAINGPTRFLRIKGPRTLLVQSSYNVYLPATPLRKSNADRLGTTPLALTPQQSRDYLSYASVSKGGEVEFQSTSDFQESIDKVKNLAKKKN